MAGPTSTPNLRYARGPTSTASYPALSGVQINPGDLLLVSGGVAFPVSQVISWNSGNEIQNWSGARSQFVGASLSQHNSTDPVSGAVTSLLEGFFTYPLLTASGTNYTAGQFVS